MNKRRPRATQNGDGDGDAMRCESCGNCRERRVGSAPWAVGVVLGQHPGERTRVFRPEDWRFAAVSGQMEEAFAVMRK